MVNTQIFSTLENTPLEIDLVAQARTTGWSFSGEIATHKSCNAGSIILTGRTIVAGQSYKISFFINSISGGYVQPFMGDTAGTQYTTTGFKEATILCSGTTPKLRFYSNANCEIQYLTMQDTATVTSAKQTNTIAYSERLNKWTSFYNYNPDCGFGLFINLYTFKNGNLYVHDKNGTRNNLYGTQYNTIINMPFNQNVAFVSTFESMSVQSNVLMITTSEGVVTSLGQVTDLIASDFTKSTLVDGNTTVTINSVEGVYSSSFMRDINSVGGIVNGDVLKGNWLTVEVITTASTILRLFSVAVHSEKSFIGVR
jgi:hypothetical protein